MYPSRKDWRDSIMPILRGGGMGFLTGVIPGGGAVITTFMSYAIEKKISKHPEKFGHGAIEGVAGPETANNAAMQGHFLPLLCLGLPLTGSMALILGALMMHGVQVGPLLIQNHPDIFWGVATSMYVGNAMLLALNLPLIPLWVRLLKIPYHFLFSLIILLCLVGVYSINNNLFDIVVMIAFGIIGYLMRQKKYDPTPLILGLILSPILENSFRQTLIISQGKFSIFLVRPICATFLIATIGVLIAKPLIRSYNAFRRLSEN
jgi:putative tricarboxylic transport membrane protein